MTRNVILVRVGLLHGGLVCLLVAALATADLPVKGSALGGGLMALSFALLWGLGRALVSGRGSLVPLLALTKVALYLGLAAAALTGRIVADGAGFAAGVACFLLATVAVAVFAPPTKETVS